jgi:hypothetical protein
LLKGGTSRSAPLSFMSIGKDATTPTPVSKISSPLLDLTGFPLYSPTGSGAPTHPWRSFLRRGRLSPPTGATRHRRRAPVRFATLSTSRSGALSPAYSCPVGAWGSHEVVEEHLPDVWPLGTRCRSCHDGAPCRRCTPVGLAGSWAAQSGPPVPVGQAVHRVGWAVKAVVGLAPCRFWPGGPGIQEISFPFV